MQVVHQPVRVDGLEPLQGERRAGTVAQQPLEPSSVIGLDPNRGIERETAAAVVPLKSLQAVPGAISAQWSSPSPDFLSGRSRGCECSPDIRSSLTLFHVARQSVARGIIRQ